VATAAGCRAMLLRPGAAGVLTSAAAAPRTGGGGSPRPPGVGLPGAVRGRWPGDLDQSRRRCEDDRPRQVCSSRHTSNRPGNHAPPAAGRTSRSVVSKQAYPTADSRSKVRRRLPAPPATMLRPNQRLTARQRPAHAGTSVHVPAHGDQRCPSLIAAWPHPTLASRRSGPPARTRSPDQELQLAGPAQRAHTTTPELGCGQARTRARIGDPAPAEAGSPRFLRHVRWPGQSGA
jgi:hypothetical protein